MGFIDTFLSQKANPRMLTNMAVKMPMMAQR
jgi:hypothetical protein